MGCGSDCMHILDLVLLLTTYLESGCNDAATLATPPLRPGTSTSVVNLDQYSHASSFSPLTHSIHTTMASGVPITNTLFPPPPGYYKAFTPDAVARYAALRGDNNGAGPSSSTDAAGASDSAAGPSEPAVAEPGEMEELAAAMEPPRADWVLEEGRWMLFGQMYTVRIGVSSAPSWPPLGLSSPPILTRPLLLPISPLPQPC